MILYDIVSLSLSIGEKKGIEERWYNTPNVVQKLLFLTLLKLKHNFLQFY